MNPPTIEEYAVRLQNEVIQRNLAEAVIASQNNQIEYLRKKNIKQRDQIRGYMEFAYWVKLVCPEIRQKIKALQPKKK